MIICKYLTRMPANRITTSLVIAFMSPFFPVFDFIFSYAVVSVHIIAMRPVLCRRRYFFSSYETEFECTGKFSGLAVRSNSVKTYGVCNDILMVFVFKVEIRLHRDGYTVTADKTAEDDEDLFVLHQEYWMRTHLVANL